MVILNSDLENFNGGGGTNYYSISSFVPHFLRIINGMKGKYDRNKFKRS